MSEAAADSGAFSGNFMFVGNLANDAKSGKQIRSHLMREYYRKERWKKCVSHRQRPGLDWKPKQDGQMEQPGVPKNHAGKKSSSMQNGTKRVRTSAAVPPPPPATIASTSTAGPAQQSRSLSQESLPPLHIPNTRSSSLTPYTARHSPASLSPEQLPEPLFCPPQPKRSDDLSSAAEITFSSYIPTDPLGTEPDSDTEPSKPKQRKKHRSLAEDFYVKRPSLCGSPGSEIYVGPFGYLPIKLNQTDHSVLQYYTRMPEIVYNLGPNDLHAIHKTIFLPIAFVYPETLYMALASASLYMSSRYGQVDRSLTDFYKNKAYARIQENMDNSDSRYADAVVGGLSGSAVLALGAVPEQGDFLEFMQHMMGLCQVMRVRGGHQSLRDNPRLDIGYSSVLLIIGKTYSDCLGKIIPPGFEQYAEADIFEFHQDANLFADWLRRACRWCKSLVSSKSLHLAVSRRQADMFRRDEALYSILDWPLALNDASPKRTMFERSHHTFALIYLALAIFEFHDQPSAIKDAFLERVNNNLKHNDISKRYTTVSLAWMLLQIFSDQPERMWMTMAFSKIVWRSSIEYFEILKNFLLWFVCPWESEDESFPILSEEMISQITQDATRGLSTNFSYYHSNGST